jgi:hypothetical protein
LSTGIESVYPGNERTFEEAAVEYVVDLEQRGRPHAGVAGHPHDRRDRREPTPVACASARDPTLD